ncbi:hypothetical protein BKA69DRAFT_1121787 [Paraphysoderma sedebokerense]|nr:hypothetical protein BKA69DRAFT_1121787 [Paraphysoderma sedebokerense]
MFTLGRRRSAKSKSGRDQPSFPFPDLPQFRGYENAVLYTETVVACPNGGITLPQGLHRGKSTLRRRGTLKKRLQTTLTRKLRPQVAATDEHHGPVLDFRQSQYLNDSANSSGAAINPSNMVHQSPPSGHLARTAPDQPHYAIYGISEVLTEKRSIMWIAEPVDAPENVEETVQTPPLPWDIDVTSFAPTLDKIEDAFQVMVEVPFSLRYRPCQACFQEGIVKCGDCKGQLVKCIDCAGAGCMANGNMCDGCQGLAVTLCKTCKNAGVQECTLCRGKKNVKLYLALRVVWIRKLTRHSYSPHYSIPPQHLGTVDGILSVTDIENCNVTDQVRLDFQSFHRELMDKFQQELPDIQLQSLLGQRYRLTLIPVCLVGEVSKGGWFRKRKEKHVVFGNKKKKLMKLKM